MQNQRKEIRVTPSDSLDGYLYELVSAPLQAVVVDIATRGVGARVNRPVAKGAKVCLSCGGLEVVGSVVRCDSNGSGHVIGIQLEHSAQRIGQLRSLNRLLLEAKVHAPPAPDETRVSTSPE